MAGEEFQFLLALTCTRHWLDPTWNMAASAWAGAALNFLFKVERVQQQCLKKIVGAHKCSSSDATEVIAGVIPMRFRIRELCIREYTKLISKDESNKLKQDLIESAVIKRKYTP